MTWEEEPLTLVLRLPWWLSDIELWQAVLALPSQCCVLAIQKTFAMSPSCPTASWMYFWCLAVSPQFNFPTHAECSVTLIAVLKTKANRSPKCWYSLLYCCFIHRINEAKDILTQFHNDACGMVPRKCNCPKRILTQVSRDQCCFLHSSGVKQLTNDWDWWHEVAKRLTALCRLDTTAHCTTVLV